MSKFWTVIVVSFVLHSENPLVDKISAPAAISAKATVVATKAARMLGKPSLCLGVADVLWYINGKARVQPNSGTLNLVDRCCDRSDYNPESLK